MSLAPHSPKLRLNVLGTPEFLLDEKPVTAFNSNKSRALLIYLAVTRQTYTRPMLAGLFWGDLSEEKAQTNLRKSIANLRKLFGDYLNVTRQTVAFNSDRDHWLDIFEVAAVAEKHADQAAAVNDI